MKNKFNAIATQKDVTSLRDQLRYERYEAITRKLHGYSTPKRAAVLDRFFKDGHGPLIVAQKRGQESGTSFIEYLADRDEVVLVRAILHHASDHLPHSDILDKIHHGYLHNKDKAIMLVLLGEEPAAMPAPVPQAL